MREYLVTCPRCGFDVPIARGDEQSVLGVLPEHKLRGDDRALNDWFCGGSGEEVSTIGMPYREKR